MDISFEDVLRDMVNNPWPYVLILLWIVISWKMSQDEKDGFFVRLVKNFFFFIGMVIFHEIAPTFFWIITGVALVISFVLALVTRDK